MLVRDMKKLAKNVSAVIPDINWGGCAVFASLIGQRLQKYYDVKVLVYTNRNTGKTIDGVRSNIKNNNPDEWNDNGIYFGHVVLEYVDKKGKVRHYDSCGIYPADGSICLTQDLIPGYLTVDECIELASSPNWNYQFNRNNIPLMKRMINDFFDISDIKYGY